MGMCCARVGGSVGTFFLPRRCFAPRMHCLILALHMSISGSARIRTTSSSSACCGSFEPRASCAAPTLDLAIAAGALLYVPSVGALLRHLARRVAGGTRVRVADGPRDEDNASAAWAANRIAAEAHVWPGTAAPRWRPRR